MVKDKVEQLQAWILNMYINTRYVDLRNTEIYFWFYLLFIAVVPFQFCSSLLSRPLVSYHYFSYIQLQWMPAPPMGMYVQGGVQYAAQQQAPVGAVPYHPFVPGQGIVPIPVHVPPPPLGATQAQQGTPEQQQTAAALALMGAASAAASAVGGPGVAGQLPMPQDHAALAAFLAAAQNLKGVLEGQLSSLQGYLDQLAQQQQQARQPSDNSTATPQPQPPLPAAEPVVASEGEAPIRPPLEEGQEPSTGDAPSSGVVNGTEERPGSSASNSSRVDEADEVRKRRLQRFAGNDIGE